MSPESCLNSTMVETQNCFLGLFLSLTAATSVGSETLVYSLVLSDKVKGSSSLHHWEV